MLVLAALLFGALSLLAATAVPASDAAGQPRVAVGFRVETIAQVPKARELAALPNGDLLVGTESNLIYIVPGAEGSAQAPHVFAQLPEGPANGVTFAPDGAIYAASEFHVYKIAYTPGARSGTPVSIGSVRTGPISSHTDGDVHHTSSLAATKSTLYVGVGSSCNACVEDDPTRATIQTMGLDGRGMTTRAKHFRNAIALTVNPATGSLWAGGAGQDNLRYDHPYEFFDDVSAHAGVADYGWPACEENHNPFGSGANCSVTVAPRVELPAYATIIGATFYPRNPHGRYAFPAAYRGGAFLSAHGSWHCCPATPPRVVYVPFTGDTPDRPVNWNDPSAQWRPFLTGFGSGSAASYDGRPTGIAVGAQGSLFVGDDAKGVVYRIRPS